MISQQKIDEISRKVNIVEIIDQYVPLKKRGKNYFGFCPFHDERTPSFSVAEDKQIFKCFSCGRAGNIFQFFVQKDNVSYVEAVIQVAHLVNVDIDDTTYVKREKTPQEIEKEALIQMHEDAMELYHYILVNTVQGEKALNYLLDRGLSMETIQTFKLGVALENRDLLLKLFRDKKYDEKLFEKSGLILSYDNKKLDRFYNRIIVPLRNELGQCIAFSGRVYQDDEILSRDEFKQPKYLNSPETIIFNKSTFLFNADLSKKEARRLSTYVLSEGYMDVIAMYQAGVKNVVASMGTSLTVQQIDRIKKSVSKVIIAYDGDEAGVHATDRAIHLIKEHSDLSVNVLQMIENLDPDEIIQTKGATYFVNMLSEDSISTFSFYKEFYKNKYVLTTEQGQSDYIDALLLEITQEKSPITQDIYLNELSKLFSISIDALRRQLEYFKRQKNNKKKSQVKNVITELQLEQKISSHDITPNIKAQKQLLFRVLTNHDAYIKFLEYENQIEKIFVQEDYATIWLLYKGFREKRSFNVPSDQFLLELKDAHLTKIVSELLYLDFDKNFTNQEMEDLVSFIKKDEVDNRLKTIKFQIEEAQKSGDSSKISQLLQEINQIVKKK